MFRKLSMAALVAALMVIVPSHVDAQQRGSERRAQVNSSNQQANRPATAPEGLRKAWEGRTPPPALLKRFPDLAPQPEAEPAPETPPPAPEPTDTCPSTFMPGPDGSFVEVDCNGNIVGME